MTKIFGHRGSAGTHPENTMIGFQEAERVGADGIEFDIQLTKDGVPVIIHDETLERTTNGTGYVAHKTYVELRNYDASYTYSGQFGFNPIPSLEEVLQWGQSTNLLFNIELKNNVLPYEGIEQKVIDLVHAFQLKDRVIISSFNHESIYRCRLIDSNIETAALYEEKLFKPWNYAKTIGVEGTHPHIQVFDLTVLSEAKKAGLAVRPYIVNKSKIIRQMIKSQVSGFFTDCPKKAINIRDGKLRK